MLTFGRCRIGRAGIAAATALTGAAVIIVGTVPAAAGTTYPVTATVMVGSQPKGDAVDPGRNTLYVANEGAGSVSVINESTNAVTSTIQVGAVPTAVSIDTERHVSYVANSGSGSVSVIDNARDSVVATIPVGIDPSGVAVDAGNQTVYVANSDSYTVSVINELTNSVIDTIGVGGFPIGLAVDERTHNAFVTNSDAGTVSVIDGTTHAIKATITVGREPVDVAVDPLSQLLFVTNILDDDVSVVNEATLSVIRVVTLPKGYGPDAIAVDPNSHTVLVSEKGVGITSVIDEQLLEIVANAGISGDGIAIDPTTHAVYLTDDGSNLLSVLTPTTSTPVTIASSLSDGTQAGTAITVPAGTAVTDSVTFSGAHAATASGRIYYRVYSDRDCSVLVDDGGLLNVSDGVAPASSPISITAPGTYYWGIYYTGDTYNEVGGGCAQVETVTDIHGCAGAPVVTSVVSSDGLVASNTLSAPLFSSVGSSLLLAFIESDGPSAPTQTVLTMSGGFGLTWTLAVRSNRTWGTTEVWQTSTIGEVDNIGVRATLAHAAHGSITIVALHTSARRVGAISKGAAMSGPARTSIVPQACGSLILSAGHDWTHSRTVTPAAGQSLLHVLNDTSVDDTYWTQQVISPTRDTGPMITKTYGPIGDRWTMASVEVPGA